MLSTQATPVYKAGQNINAPFLFDQNKFENHAYCITATSYSSRLPVQVLLILPNLWILGFAMSVPQVEHVVIVFLVLDFVIE